MLLPPGIKQIPSQCPTISGHWFWLRKLTSLAVQYGATLGERGYCLNKYESNFQFVRSDRITPHQSILIVIPLSSFIILCIFFHGSENRHNISRLEQLKVKIYFKLIQLIVK